MRKLRVLVGCETSGKVRQAFRRLGHDAWSVDLLPSDDNSEHHIQGDIISVLIAHTTRARWQQPMPHGLPRRWDIGIFHPPCTRLCNIVGRGPDFTIQPWQFGHGEVKRTCFWTRGLPPLVPTDVVEGRKARIHRMAPSAERWKQRSETYQGIADAIADQWGGFVQRAIEERDAA